MSSKTNILDTAKHVISAEAEALNSLAASLNGSFVSAVETILAAKGHIIVVGIGKSGHIGRKIAASLASTGTPSFFLHPSEAAHGDLGMISEGAVILALSHSGESAEVNIVADYAKEQNHPIIAICGVKKSSLAKKPIPSLSCQTWMRPAQINLRQPHQPRRPWLSGTPSVWR